jgi:ParB-like chromosome segregation protein Spo0J
MTDRPLLVSEIRVRKIADLSEDPANARKHGPTNLEAIKASLRAYGQRKPIVVTESGVVLAGNGTLRAAKALGWTDIATVPADLDGVEARGFAIADNRTAELAEWDEDVLAATLSAIGDESPEVLAATGFSDADVREILEGLEGGSKGTGEGAYTQKVERPVYEPSGPAPAVGEMFDRTRADELAREIGEADLPDDVRAFLLEAARRHVVFRYDRIANFYAHAGPDLQRLMERSALVIVDFDDAIASGFVRLNARVDEQFGKDYPDA